MKDLIKVPVVVQAGKPDEDSKVFLRVVSASKTEIEHNNHLRKTREELVREGYIEPILLTDQRFLRVAAKTFLEEDSSGVSMPFQLDSMLKHSNPICGTISIRSTGISISITGYSDYYSIDGVHPGIVSLNNNDGIPHLVAYGDINKEEPTVDEHLINAAESCRA